MANHIFVSYSHDDAAQAAVVVNGLRASGFVVWQDTSDIRATDSWFSKIAGGISESAVFVVLWSATAADPKRFVVREVEIAQTQSKPITALVLDSTPLPPGLATSHSIFVKGNLTKVVEDLINHLAERYPDIRRRRTGFTFGKPLAEQNPSRELVLDPQTTLAWVPLLKSGYCEAHVVGTSDAVIYPPKAVQVCLQFSRATNWAFVPDVYRWVMKTRQEGSDLSFVALCITSPIKPTNGEYYLDNDNSAVWLDAIDTTFAAIEVFSEVARPVIQVFNLAPASLMLGLGLKFYRFWDVQIYNFDMDDKTYKRVYDLLPDSK